jgi:hypothetical protein
MSEFSDRVSLGDVVLAHNGAQTTSDLRAAGDRKVLLGAVITRLRSQGLIKAQQQAEVSVVPITSLSQAIRHPQRWSKPSCESIRVKRAEKMLAAKQLRQKPYFDNTLRLGDGRRVQDPKDGYLLSDLAAFLKITQPWCRKIAKELRLVTRIPNTTFYAPLSRAQARVLVQYVRQGRSKS